MQPKEKVIQEAFKRHISIVEKSISDILPDVGQGAQILHAAMQQKKLILVAGNGGSAADAQHFAAELVGRYKKERRPFRAVALTTDTSALTAIGNDYGFERIFERQVEALGSDGDVFVAFTTSGGSENIRTAIAQAKKQGIKTILLTSTKGALLAQEVDVAILVPSEETARIQEMHELVYHAWCEYLDVHQ